MSQKYQYKSQPILKSSKLLKYKKKPKKTKKKSK